MNTPAVYWAEPDDDDDENPHAFDLHRFFDAIDRNVPALSAGLQKILHVEYVRYIAAVEDPQSDEEIRSASVALSEAVKTFAAKWNLAGEWWTGSVIYDTLDHWLHQFRADKPISGWVVTGTPEAPPGDLPCLSPFRPDLESPEDFVARARRHTEEIIAAYESLGWVRTEARPGGADTRRDRPDYFDWLARYHVGGEDKATIATGSYVTVSTVDKAVRRLADRVGLQSLRQEERGPSSRKSR